MNTDYINIFVNIYIYFNRENKGLDPGTEHKVPKAISCDNIKFILKWKIIDRNSTNLLYLYVDKGGFPLIELQTVKESLLIR